MASPAKIQRPSDDNSSSSVRQRITNQTSLVMAASVIANPRFPHKKLIPEATPPPFHNRGHMPLFDYGLMLKAIWQVILEVQTAAGTFTHKRLKMRMFCALAACVAGLFAGLQIAVAAGIILGLVTLLFSLLLAKFFWLTPFHETLTDIRAKAVNKLLEGADPFDVESKVSKRISNELSRVGDGELGKTQIPVLTINESDHPFQGYGRLTTDNTYVCVPKERETPKKSLPDIRNNISASIRKFCEESGIAQITTGEVLVIYGPSLMIDHPILHIEPTGERVPPLWCDRAKLNELDSGLPDAPVRVFFAIQVLFPQFETLAMFFTRPFWAGNSVGYQIAISTLGPPSTDSVALREQLKKYELSQSRIDFGPAPIEEESTRLGLVQAVRTNVRSGGASFKSIDFDASAMRELEKLSLEDEQGELSKEIASLNEEAVWWPGNYIRFKNYRELNSLAFTKSYFGQRETLATVRTMYLQISKVILDGLDMLGYDISDYRNEEGKYSINVDKIDSLVMGDKVYVTEKQKDPSGHRQANEVGKTDS